MFSLVRIATLASTALVAPLAVAQLVVSAEAPFHAAAAQGTVAPPPLLPPLPVPPSLALAAGQRIIRQAPAFNTDGFTVRSQGCEEAVAQRPVTCTIELSDGQRQGRAAMLRFYVRGDLALVRDRARRALDDSQVRFNIRTAPDITLHSNATNQDVHVSGQCFQGLGAANTPFTCTGQLDGVVMETALPPRDRSTPNSASTADKDRGEELLQLAVMAVARSRP